VADIGSLALKLTANPTPLEKGLDDAVKSTKRMADRMTTTLDKGINKAVNEADRDLERIGRNAQPKGIRGFVARARGALDRLGLGGGLGGVVAGAAIVGAARGLAALAASEAAVIDNLAKMARRIGITTDELQAFTQVASLNGVAMDKVVDLFKEQILVKGRK